MKYYRVKGFRSLGITTIINYTLYSFKSSYDIIESASFLLTLIPIHRKFYHNIHRLENMSTASLILLLFVYSIFKPLSNYKTSSESIFSFMFMTSSLTVIVTQMQKHLQWVYFWNSNTVIKTFIGILSWSNSLHHGSYVVNASWTMLHHLFTDSTLSLSFPRFLSLLIKSPFSEIYFSFSCS